MGLGRRPWALRAVGGRGEAEGRAAWVVQGPRRTAEELCLLEVLSGKLTLFVDYS